MNDSQIGISRRSFLAAATSGAVLVAGIRASKTVFGANDRVHVACIGLHGRGRTHIREFSEIPDCEVVALCDVDRRVLEKQASELRRKTGKSPKLFVDMRELLQDSEIDAVSFATPNHWHALGTIWACQAGKDVYVEKPISHNFWEGRQVVKAAEKYGRVVQHGTQRRSDPGWIRAIQRLREGVIGEIYMARGLCYKPRESIGFEPDKESPDWLDWNLWLGPATYREYNPNYVHYNWHWFWDFGNGDLGNQGVHQMDVAVWGLNKGLPIRIFSEGGRFGYKDQGETPNTQVCMFTYADGSILSFEVRGLPTNAEESVKIGTFFYGSDGYMVEKKFFDKNGKEIPDPQVSKVQHKKSRKDTQIEGNPFADFIKAVRSRNPTDIRATAYDGHIASAHCHLGNIAYRLGSEISFDPVSERFVGEMGDHANQLLKREYRSGFEIPELT